MRGTRKEYFMGKTMLKTLAVALLGLLVASAAFAKTKKESAGIWLPAFANDDAYVFANETIKKNPRKSAQFINQSDDSGLSFRLYVYNKKTEEWMLFGTVAMRGFGDTREMEKMNKKMKLWSYRYYAIQPMKGTRADYDYDLTVKHGNLIVTVYDRDYR